VASSYWIVTRFAASKRNGRANFYVMTTLFSTVGVLAMDGNTSPLSLLILGWIVVAYLGYTMRTSRTA